MEERDLRREEKWLQDVKGILPGTLSCKARQKMKDGEVFIDMKAFPPPEVARKDETDSHLY